MSRSFLGLFIIFLAISVCYCGKYSRHRNYSLLIDFTCATARDELEKHPEMRTIAMIELENNFPSEFSREILKCLPVDVAKVIMNPHTHSKKNIIQKFPKETLVIYVADKVEWGEIFNSSPFYFAKNFRVVSHLSKHLIVSSDETKIIKTTTIFGVLLNAVQIYEKNRKVVVKSYDRSKFLQKVTSSQRKNLSKFLFPDKVKNLKREKIYTVYDLNLDAQFIKGSDRPNNKWIPYLDIIAEKLNTTLKFKEIKPGERSYWKNRESLMKDLIDNYELDFDLNYQWKFELQSYNNVDWCFIAPLPKPYSITELILFLPMDTSCWMWLGITIAVSTLIWRISEGHWNFAFSHFMGQAQLSVRIRTNRLTMKILLQLLIFAIFIFSNGYQSIVTSFMLKPMQQKLLKTIEEVFDSDLGINYGASFNLLYDDNPKYQRAKQDGRIVNTYISASNWTEVSIDMNLAFIQHCNVNKMRTAYQGYKVGEYLYVVDEVAYTLPADLYTRPFHPYIESFQELMDRTFEAGLHQAWERFFWEIWSSGEKRRESIEKEELLDFGLIIPFFLILAFGFGAAVLAPMCEIFCKDFMMELTKEYFGRKWNEIFERNVKIHNAKLKVKRIQVKPAPRIRRSSV